MAGSTALRIVHCVRSPVGGIFRHIEELVRFQHDAGHAVGVVYDSLTEGDNERAHAERLAQWLALGITRVPMQRRIGPSDIATAIRVHRTLRGMAPDIIHGHGSKGGAYARLIGTFLRAGGHQVARVYTPHGGSLHYDPSRLAGRVYFALESALCRVTDGIVFVCDFEARTFHDKIGHPNCQARTVHNGLRAEEFEIVEPASDATDFVFVGTLRDLKGPDLVLDALAAPGSDASATIVGDGEMRAELEARAKTLGEQARIRFTGALPARQAFALGRAVVLPSRAESLPYIVLEAIAAGRPVIASRVGGIPEIFHGHDHRLVPPDDAAALADAMADYRENPERAREFALLHRDEIKARFSAEVMADRITALYRDLVSRPESERSRGPFRPFEDRA